MKYFAQKIGENEGEAVFYLQIGRASCRERVYVLV